MRVLVTGGAGFIGSHLVDRFRLEGFQVRVLDSLDPRVHPKGLATNLPPGVEFMKGDVTNREELLAALQDVDIVSHQAAYQDYMPDFSRFLHVNAVGTALIYELIVEQKLKVKKVIVASSQAVYGEGQFICSTHGFFQPVPRSQQQLSQGHWEVRCPDCDQQAEPRLLSEENVNPYNQYAVSKLAEERVALGLGWLHGIPSVALRYSITQGPRQSLFNQYSGICRIFVGRALQGNPLIVYEDGHQTRDFVHIKDVVEANVRVLESDDANFQAFNVGSGKSTTVLEYANLVGEKLSSEVNINLSGEYRRGDNRNSVSKIDKLRRLGWNPKSDLSAILDDFLSWVESIGGIPIQVRDADGDMRRAGVVLKATADSHVSASNVNL
ncbi:MAG TPA: NAD-dependent epimerase/dehydratase family protein [Chthoniobacterales bacterium]|nr:NAD-dependent epimerase/dehydratase family protein [Chthoniobacterales bacterium]